MDPEFVCRGPKKVTRAPDSTANQKYSGHRNLGLPELLSSKPKKNKLDDRSAQFKELKVYLMRKLDDRSEQFKEFRSCLLDKSEQPRK